MAVSRRRQQGFTLIELVMVILLIGILAALAAPSLDGLIANSRAAAASNELIGAITVARSEAVKRGQPVSVCAARSEGAALCSNNAGDTAWQKGWIVFVDASGDPGSIDGDDEILRSFGSLPGRVSLEGDGRFVSYGATGMLGSAALNWELRAPRCVQNNNRDIRLSAVGRPQVSHVAC